MDDDVGRLARSFGPVADAYDRGRPSFPAEAVSWLVGKEAATVLELGAGTGKLTERLVALGHDVHATDPDPGMLAVLRRKLPDVRTSEAGAEEIPLGDRSVDAVIVGQAFHWFDPDRALPEIARVLRPGGAVGVAWNLRDESIPWVRRLGRILQSRESNETHEAVQDSSENLERSDLFGDVDERRFAFWQEVNRETIVDLAASRSYISTLDEDARAAVLDSVLELYDDYGRGMDGMKLPYRCECFRAVVADRHDDQPGTAVAGDDPPVSDAPSGPSDGTDTDMLLIDFR